MPVSGRIKAFTIIELLIALLLSSMVGSAAYLALRLARRQFVAVNLKYEALSQLNTVAFLLKTDFENSNVLMASGHEKTVVVTCRSDSAAISYSFSDSLIIRRQAIRTDSFKVKSIETVLFFEKKPIVAGSSGCIDRITIKADIQGELVPVEAAKMYSASELIATEKMCGDLKQKQAEI